MSALGRKLTIAAICGAIAVAVASADTLFGQVEKHFGSSPYFIFMQDLKYELAILVIGSILIHRTTSFWSGRSYATIRNNWKGRKLVVFGYSLHIEEWLLLATLSFVVVSFAVHSALKTSAIHQTAGLLYIEAEACKGNFQEAISRARLIKDNPLWRKYRSYLQGSLERYGHLNEIGDKRLAQFQAVKDRSSIDDTLAEALELRLIFGIDPRLIMGEIPIRSSNIGILEEWRKFLSTSGC